LIFLALCSVLTSGVAIGVLCEKSSRQPARAPAKPTFPHNPKLRSPRAFRIIHSKSLRRNKHHVPVSMGSAVEEKKKRWAESWTLEFVRSSMAKKSVNNKKSEKGPLSSMPANKHKHRDVGSVNSFHSNAKIKKSNWNHALDRWANACFCADFHESLQGLVFRVLTGGNLTSQFNPQLSKEEIPKS